MILMNDLNNLIPDHFDWRFYCNYYTDLKFAGIDNEKKAFDHYNNFGIKENRLTNISMVNTKMDSEIIYDKSFYHVSKLFFDHLINVTRLEKNHKVLEIGCGIGSFAMA